MKIKATLGFLGIATYLTEMYFESVVNNCHHRDMQNNIKKKESGKTTIAAQRGN